LAADRSGTASGLSDVGIKNIERGRVTPRSSTIERLERAFDEAGVLFFEAGEVKDGGPGLRLKSRE
jgi:predicted transcriptional regulator